MIGKTMLLRIVAVAVCATFLSGTAAAGRLIPGSKVNTRHESGEKRQGGAKERTVEAPYSTGLSLGFQDVFTVCLDYAPLTSCVFVPAGMNENFASVEIVDASGLPVMAIVGPHDEDPAGQAICGTTPKPIRIVPGIEVEVALNVADPAVPCPGVATTGVVKVTLSKRP